MSRLQRVASGVTAALAVAGSLVAVRDAAATTSDRDPAPSGAARTVTLLTGDRVTVFDDGNFTVEPGPGRDAMTFLSRRAGGRLTVTPGDAVGPLGAGQLDPRLFDVTTLLAFGYDDRRADLPLIVTAGAAAVPAAGAAVDRRLPRLGAVAMRQDRKKPGEFWRTLRSQSTPVSRVWLDGMRQPALDVSVPQVGAPAAWDAGYTGAGVTVAVLDSGVDDAHPDLAGTVAARANFTEGWEDDRDLTGHGTHVAATIAGNGTTYRGVAPRSRLLDGKVCVVAGCAESWILAGMEWAAAEQHAAVVNLSLGGYDAPEVDPLEQAVNTLTERYGTLFVVAAGNDGFPESVSSPASADAALAVGAVDGHDALANFSSRGPRIGDGAIKPDITAPGVDITAARAIAGGHTTMSGTSMAAPHVAGAAAILAERHPDWDAGRLKAALMGTAKPTPGLDAFGQGAGRVDVAAAVGQPVTAEPPSVDFGMQRWPHGDDEVVTRDIAYRNAGSEPVELALTVEGAAGTVAVRPTTVTVPAGGAATVTLSADTRVAGPDGRLTGALVATAGGRAVRTPFTVHKEIESYDVTLTHVGVDGAPAGTYFATLDRWATGVEYSVVGQTGTDTVRLPKGRYTLDSFVLPPDGGEPRASLLAQPALDVTAAVTVVVDARRAVASSVRVPDASATQLFASVGAMRGTGADARETQFFAESFDQLYTAQIGGDVDGYSSSLNGVWARDGVSYHLRYDRAGGMISGFHHTVARSELATIEATYRGGNDDGMLSTWHLVSRVPGQVEAHAPTVALPVRQPGAVTRHVNNGDVEWRSTAYDRTDSCTCGRVTDRWTRYTPGRVYRQTWNPAVFGPVLPRPDDPNTRAVRSGDTIAVDLSLYGDGAGRDGVSGDAGSTTLYRDGAKVGASATGGYGEFAVPPADAAYRLVVHSERGAPYALSTKIDVEWAFRSRRADNARVLPLWAVRFAPPLDRRNTAPGGRVLAVPVTVEPAPGAVVGEPRALTVAASFDGGATWATVPVLGGAALVRHPDGGGFVSLRAIARDAAGNTVTQTITHAYRYA
ncbi:S8 family serine peptidase [Actinomycetes bacterium KLBMP 9797]